MDITSAQLNRIYCAVDYMSNLEGQDHTLVIEMSQAMLNDVIEGRNLSVTGNIGRFAGPLCMGIDWMTGVELSQAIPPAYTEYIGHQLLEGIRDGDS